MSSLQSYPGNDDIPAILEGGNNFLDTWRAAQVILQGAYMYATEKISYSSLEAAGHVLPKGWRFERDGVWRCRHCKTDVWRSHEEFAKEKARLAELAARAADDDGDAQKELTQLLKKHAETHLDAMYSEAPIGRIGTDFFIVNPIYCLKLNLAKTAWKHSFGNRMLPYHRERIAEYLDKIGCPLDIRENGKRDSLQNWFTASSFDEYVNGASHRQKSASPGLADQAPASTPTAASTTGAAQQTADDAAVTKLNFSGLDFPSPLPASTQR
eukprot:6196489-Pleurochrysis_carterae.AAC.4